MGHLDNVIRPGSSGTTGRLNDRSVTIADVLREAGYFTAMSGKWHLGQDNGSPPWQRGFDRVLSLRAGGMVPSSGPAVATTRSPKASASTDRHISTRCLTVSGDIATEKPPSS